MMTQNAFIAFTAIDSITIVKGAEAKCAKGY